MGNVSVGEVRTQVGVGTKAMGELTGVLGGVSEKVPEALSTAALADEVEAIVGELQARANIASDPNGKLPEFHGAVEKHRSAAHDILTVVMQGSVDAGQIGGPLHYMEENNQKSNAGAEQYGTTVNEMATSLSGLLTVLREQAPAQVAIIEDKTKNAIVQGNAASEKADKFVKTL